MISLIPKGRHCIIKDIATILILTKDLPPPHNINPLSGSTTSSPHSLITSEISDYSLEVFTDELALIDSFPPRNDDMSSTKNHDKDDVYNDPFDSKEDKIKESKLLIDELNPPRSSDFLPSPECDSVLYEDFSGEYFNPPLYELPFHKEVPGSETLLSFSSENEEKVHVSALNNDEKVVGADVAIPVAVVDEISENFANTLYGYFIGERLAFPTVEAYVKNAWAKYGFERAIFRNGFFFFKFSSHEGMVKTIEGGPWFIRSMPIFLNVWSPNTKLKKEKITRVPVWVKIHNVHVVAFSETGLSLITTQLGRPIRLDACTSDMCLNPWGHNSYARVLVKLSSECVIMESIVVAIPLPKGEGHYLETLDVEYEWWPPRCSKCKVFYHEDDYCLAKVRKANSDPSSGKGSGQDAGFINKKKGGNMTANKKDIQGIRFSKPKSNFMYRLVSKSITTKEIASKPNTNAPSFNEDVNGADLQPNTPPKVIMDDSYGSTNEHGYFKDDIDLGQLRSNIKKLMDKDKVLDINTNNEIDGVVEPLNSMPKTNEGSTSTNTVPADVNDSYKGSLWEQFSKSREASKSRHKSPMSGTDESDEDEVFMPGVIPGEGFLDDMEDDLDFYDGYEAQVYDLSEKEKAFCDQYDIRLNSRCRK
ncbi:zinc knuckle CX2CX4HX4C containing protein [Tanacetum coccineum]